MKSNWTASEAQNNIWHLCVTEYLSEAYHGRRSVGNSRDCLGQGCHPNESALSSYCYSIANLGGHDG
jgi:hypothetical protein